MSTKDYKLKKLQTEIHVLKKLLLEDLNNGIFYHETNEHFSKLLECKYLLETHHKYLEIEFSASYNPSSDFDKKFLGQDLIRATNLKNKLNSFLIAYLQL